MWKQERARRNDREGWIDLNFAREKDGDRRSRGEAGEDSEHVGADRPARRRKRQESPEIGNALRSAYQQTINETVPDDLLNLLGKLT